MTSIRTRLIRAAITLGLVVAATACSPPGSPGTGSQDAGTYPSGPVTLLVPAAPGGGWDSTARSLQQVVTEAHLTDQSVEVVNREGGGGATGLAQITGQDSGDPNTLMLGGLVMIGALVQADSPLKVTDATTIATLTSETEAFVVRKDSPFTSIQQVVDQYAADPTSVIFGGGSAGGSDHIAAGLLLKAAGQQPAGLKYVGYAGGGEATAGILSGDVEVGISGLSEFVGQIESGDMRLLAVSSDAGDVAGQPAPTLQAAGYDVDFVNWRGLFAPPGISDEQKAAITDFVTKIHDSSQWSDILAKRGWADDFRTGDEAAEFVRSQNDTVTGTLQELGL
ncbi:Bug family tripartite tricarboxylate transporter substrate binding protein [Pseudonocardia sp. DLS-67]